MTSNITPITAADGGDTDNRTEEKLQREHGLAVLRTREGRGLISLVCDAVYEASNLASDMHSRLYADGPAYGRDLLQQVAEGRECLEAAEHYLLMLGSVVEERIPPPDPDDPRQVEPAF